MNMDMDSHKRYFRTSISLADDDNMTIHNLHYYLALKWNEQRNIVRFVI